MPAVEALRSFARARVCVVALLALAAAGCSDPTGPSDAFVDAPAFDLAPTPVTMMASASEHACVLRTTGAIECWGDDTYGEAPHYREAIGGWYTHVDVSDEHGCAVRNDGNVECWGRNTFGKAPTSVLPAAGQFVRVAAGGDHSCGVRTDGNIQCWGDDTDDQAPSTVEPSTSSFVRVTAGLFHTCGLRADGVAECWGFNFSQAPATRAPRNGSPYISISSNTGHTCAVRTDGAVECWGINDFGQADTLRSPASSSFTQVSAGLTHTCALRADGIAECWGQNDHGEALNPWSTTLGRYTHVAAGNHFSCGSRTGGTVVCVGTHAAPIPERPASISAALIGGDMQISWPEDTVETQFRVERRERPDVAWSDWSLVLAATHPDVTSYTDSTVVGGYYQYRVRACAAGGCSIPRTSAEMYVPVPLPFRVLTVSATAVRGGVVDVSWTDTLSVETRFEVSRQQLSDSTGKYGRATALGNAAANATTFRDSTATRALTYRYRIRACNSAGCSAYVVSRAVLAETDATPSTNTVATALGPNTVQVTWTAATNAGWYEVGRRTFNGAVWNTWAVQGTQPSTGPNAWTDNTVQPGTQYQYRIRACTVVRCATYTPGPPTTTPAG